jgi:O-antigen/teichoic acid export membrane protein
LTNLYYRASKYLAAVTVPSTLFLVIAAPNILQAWVGPGYGAIPFLQALALGHCVHTLTSAGTTIVRGVGKPEVETHYTLLLLILDVALGVILISRFGSSGALLATPLALFAASIYFFAIFHRLLAAPWARLFDVYRLPVLAGLLLAGLLWPLLAVTWGAMQNAGRLVNAGGVLLIGMVYAAGYLAILWRSDYLRGPDWAPIVQYVFSAGKARLDSPAKDNPHSRGAE